MWRALAAIGAGCPADARGGGRGERARASRAGLDRSMLAPADGRRRRADAAGRRGVRRAIAGYQQGFIWLRDPRFVSIAAVHGYAIGAAFQLALACDLRVVADDVQFCMKEPALGLVPDLTGTKPLVRRLAMRGRWRSVRPRGSSGPPRPRRSDWPPSSCHPTSWTPPSPTSPRHSWPTRGRGLRHQGTAAAGGRPYLDDQRRAERVAQVGRLRELAAQMRRAPGGATGREEMSRARASPGGRWLRPPARSTPA